MSKNDKCFQGQGVMFTINIMLKQGNKPSLMHIVVFVMHFIQDQDCYFIKITYIYYKIGGFV